MCVCVCECLHAEIACIADKTNSMAIRIVMLHTTFSVLVYSVYITFARIYFCRIKQSTLQRILYAIFNTPYLTFYFQCDEWTRAVHFYFDSLWSDYKKNFLQKCWLKMQIRAVNCDFSLIIGSSWKVKIFLQKIIWKRQTYHFDN